MPVCPDSRAFHSGRLNPMQQMSLVLYIVCLWKSRAAKYVKYVIADCNFCDTCAVLCGAVCCRLPRPWAMMRVTATLVWRCLSSSRHTGGTTGGGGGDGTEGHRDLSNESHSRMQVMGCLWFAALVGALF